MIKHVELYKERRKSFQARMPGDSVALFFSGSGKIRTNDVHYRFRANSDLYYLTGFEEEDCVLALGHDFARLFLRPKNKEREIWDGYRLGVENAVESLGIDEAKDIKEFPTELNEILNNRHTLYYQYGVEADRDRLVLQAAHEVLQRSRKGSFGPASILHPSGILHEMRLFKSTHEIDLLTKSAKVTEQAHNALMQKVRPGMYEYELEAIIQFEFRRADAVEAYPSIVAAGPNACVLHYITNRDKINENDLVLVDAGAEVDYMNTDVTRTFPASGKFTGPQKDLYEIVLASQKAAIEKSVAGGTMVNAHKAAVSVLVDGLLNLKLLTGGKEEILKEEKYKKFYMHNTGHWLGIDVHDVGAYYHEGESRPLQNGMVCTVEPGLYIPTDDDPEVPEQFRGIGIRIEDDILINDDTPINLTAAIPKEIEDIEEMQS